MIAGSGFTKCQCGDEYRTSTQTGGHERWCPLHPEYKDTRYLYMGYDQKGFLYGYTDNVSCESCEKLRAELERERAARLDAERRLRFYETKRRR